MDLAAIGLRTVKANSMLVFDLPCGRVVVPLLILGVLIASAHEHVTTLL
jgi:hypothetical protein